MLDFVLIISIKYCSLFTGMILIRPEKGVLNHIFFTKKKKNCYKKEKKKVTGIVANYHLLCKSQIRAFLFVLLCFDIRPFFCPFCVFYSSIGQFPEKLVVLQPIMHCFCDMCHSG